MKKRLRLWEKMSHRRERKESVSRDAETNCIQPLCVLSCLPQAKNGVGFGLGGRRQSCHGVKRLLRGEGGWGVQSGLWRLALPVKIRSGVTGKRGEKNIAMEWKEHHRNKRNFLRLGGGGKMKSPHGWEQIEETKKKPPPNWGWEWVQVPAAKGKNKGARLCCKTAQASQGEGRGGGVILSNRNVQK